MAERRYSPFPDYHSYRRSREQLLSESACFFKVGEVRSRPWPDREGYDAKLGYRTEFQRDRDDILYSPSLRQLGYKRQLFSDPEMESFYTRLTHTLIVSQIARSISGGLRLDPLLAEAIALGHDLGHTPYGHSGEEGINRFLNKQLFPSLSGKPGYSKFSSWTIQKRVDEEREASESSLGLRLWSSESETSEAEPLTLSQLTHQFLCLPTDKKIFSHNSQAYRIVQYLEKNGRGLELCLETNYGILRASGSVRDEADFSLDGVTSDFASFEAQVVRLADDIAWVNHDLTEDLRKTQRESRELLDEYRFRFPEKNLPVYYDDLRTFLESGAGERYGQFITDAIDTNKDKLAPNGYIRVEGSPGHTISLSPRMMGYLNAMKEIVIRTVHDSLPVSGIDKGSMSEVQEICEFLADSRHFRKAIQHPGYNPEIREHIPELERYQILIDVVSLMTDGEASAFHKRYIAAHRAPREIQRISWPLRA